MTNSPAAPNATAHPPTHAYVVAFLGAIAMSLAAIFIRLAQAEEIPSLFIAAARMSIAALVITPFTLSRYLSEIRTLSRRDIRLMVVSGFFLALHFATWILSLEYTSVLISVVLVSTSPLWVAILEVTILRARLSRIVIIGLLIGMVGSIVAGLSSPGDSATAAANPLLGSLLALTGAVCVAIYFVIGRSVRSRLSLLPYIWLVYGCAALFLLAAVFFARIPIVGYSPQGYLWLAAMALIPQLLGHSSSNYVLRYLPATFVGIISQLEPVLSAVIAVITFQEIPQSLQIIGSAAILVGVVLAIFGQDHRTTSTENT
jgi:drug/metabolite transporter (DMT)-like permease